jgi:hypothetical protein
MYRGFAIYHDDEGVWASAGDGAILLGPFQSESAAEAAVDDEMDGRP